MTKINKNELIQWAKENSFQAKMTNNGLDNWNNYSGPNHGEKVMVLSRSRDAEILEDSNFECALERLGGESKHVEVVRASHWACGWIETIIVSPKSLKALNEAYNIREELDTYPVLDESDFCERENEYQSEFADSVKEELADALAKHFSLKAGKALMQVARDLNIECQCYYGNDSCIDIYSNRSPDKRDIERLKNSLEQLKYYPEYKNSVTYKKLVRAVSEFKVESKTA